MSDEGPEAGLRNEIKSGILIGNAVQARDVQSVTTNFTVSGGTAALLAVIIIAASLLVVADAGHGQDRPAPPIRLAGRVVLDGGCCGLKLIPSGRSGGLTYDEVVSNYSKTIPTEKSADWLEAHGAIGVSEARWLFQLDGLRDRAVQIHNVRTIELTCGPPLGGILLSEGIQHAGRKYIVADVDHRRPEFRIHDGGSKTAPRSFSEETIDLPKDRTVGFAVVAKTSGAHCRFRLLLQYTADGEEGSFVVPAHDVRPFEVTGEIDQAKYDAIYLGWGMPPCRGSYRISPNDQLRDC